MIPLGISLVQAVDVEYAYNMYKINLDNPE
ncbi:hypothetical protein FHS19_000101 [Paenibacillus rhizosphaerae]|uniref:Uncharacterized protein n=1 Tax=Paenibacillus rhizosphaerae TaxID=297318 RepID=A0A839TKU2_9BACL|nr:hypothetical protein [Paenibacillus rhizosphaerae]